MQSELLANSDASVVAQTLPERKGRDCLQCIAFRSERIAVFLPFSTCSGNYKMPTKPSNGAVLRTGFFYTAFVYTAGYVYARIHEEERVPTKQEQTRKKLEEDEQRWRKWNMRWQSMSEKDKEQECFREFTRTVHSYLSITRGNHGGLTTRSVLDDLDSE